MKLSVSLAALFCAAAAIAAAPANLLDNADFTAGSRGWTLLAHGPKAQKSAAAVRFADGKFQAELPEGLTRGDFQLVQPIRIDPAHDYKCSFTVTVPAPRQLFVSYRTRRNPKRNLGLAKVLELPAGTSRQQLAFSPVELPSEADGGEFCFQMGQLAGKTEISDILLYAPVVHPIQFGRDWRVVFGKTTDYTRMPAKVDKTFAIPFDAKPGKRHIIDFARIRPAASVREAVVFTEFDSPGEQLMRAGFAADWFMEIYLNGKPVYSTMDKGNGSHQLTTGDHTVNLPAKPGRNLLAIRVRSGADGWKLVWGTPEKPVQYVASRDWMPVDTRAIHVRAGTALDLSKQISAPAGKFGRAVIGANGLLAFEKTPDKPARLHGFSSFIPEEVWRSGTDKEFRQNAVRFAGAVRRQGYNLFRMHGFDQWVMYGTTADMAVSKKYLDRWDFLIAEMKKQGIYVQFVVFSFNLYSKSSGYADTFRRRNMHKMRLYMGGELEKERFRYGATTLLNHVNPYTKLAWKDDPAIVIVEYYNEEYLGMERYAEAAKFFPEDHKFVLSVWNRWLEQRYAKQPRANWPEPLRKSGFGAVEIPDGGALLNDYSIFCYERIKETNRWCDQVIREAGYRGLTTQNSALRLNSAAAGWETLQVVDNHVYYCHPSDWANPGSRVGQGSAVAQSAGYFRNLAAGKLTGRPQFVGEFNFCFWNPYQYEAGLAFNAYAAYQNFSSLAIHSHPVLARGGKFTIECFSSGSNPILRAAQFLSNMLFLRGDVTPSSKLVSLAVPKEFLETNGNGLRAVSSDQSKLALMSGFGLSFPWAPVPAGLTPGRKPDMAVQPAGSAAVFSHGWYTSVIESHDGKFSLSDAVREMKRRGILAAANQSDPDRGVFQSDTGEITLRANEKLLKVVTPRTEAVAIAQNRREPLGIMTVEKVSSRGCVALTAIDDQPLKESRRMVLVYATEVVNSNMVLTGGRATLVKIGHAPGLMKTGQLELTIAARPGTAYRLYALNLVGTRMQELPVANNADGKLRVQLDTTQLKDGNTPFFELVAVQP